MELWREFGLVIILSILIAIVGHILANEPQEKNESPTMFDKNEQDELIQKINEEQLLREQSFLPYYLKVIGPKRLIFDIGVITELIFDKDRTEYRPTIGKIYLVTSKKEYPLLGSTPGLNLVSNTNQTVLCLRKRGGYRILGIIYVATEIDPSLIYEIAIVNKMNFNHPIIRAQAKVRTSTGKTGLYFDIHQLTAGSTEVVKVNQILFWSREAGSRHIKEILYASPPEYLFT